MFRLIAIHHQIRSRLESVMQLLDDADRLIETCQDEPVLSFDNVKRTVTWLGGTATLGTKSYRFLKLLWESSGHKTKTVTLEQTVWDGNKVKKRQMTVSTPAGTRQVAVSTASVPQETMNKFLQRLKKVLCRADFPYEIVPAKNGTTGEIDGYKLKKC
ncbi:MAG: hypothetical protein LBT46_10215 [Planctomycetaceae bacterium]|nr:hypothetical protein [Planctomycetaceae bacterium]